MTTPSGPKQTSKHPRHPLRTGLGVLLRIILLSAAGLIVGMILNAALMPLLPEAWTHWLRGGETEASGESSAQGGRAIAFWKSSMIPNFVSTKPGQDPMGMDLVPVYKDQLGEERYITLSHAVMRNMGLRTVPVEHGRADHVLRTVGQVAYAEPLLGDVTLKVEGWIEKLLVNFVGEEVHKGQPLFTFYSPNLITAQQEYLISVGTEGDKSSSNELERALRFSSGPLGPYAKLRYWDVPESQIEQVRQAGTVIKSLTFESPFDGWVVEKHALEGMHMQPGTRFYRIADLRTMWVYVTVFEYQLPQLHVGQPARLTLPYQPGKLYEGRVLYIYPYVDPEKREIQVRLEFPNPDLDLKPGMYADVGIGVPADADRLIVPLDAVINTGKHKEVNGRQQRIGYAYVMAGHGRFEPRQVELGEELEGGRLEILSGLKVGEEVVVSGQFQLDSERRIKESNLRMLTEQPAQNDKTSSPKKPPASHSMKGHEHG